MRAAEVVYQAGTAAQYGIIISRPSHGELKHAPSDEDRARDIQNVGHKAWAASRWVGELAVVHNISAAELAGRAFALHDQAKLNAQLARVRQSGRRGRRIEYWSGEAVRPGPADEATSASNMLDRMPTGGMHGFAKITQETFHDLRALRIAQRVSRLGLSAHIHNLNVLPGYGRHGLGTALAYVGLRDQPQRFKSSLFTAVKNEPMRGWAEKYGYDVIEEFVETDLFGVPVPFVHYEASSVGTVLSRMEAAHPELREGDVTSMQGLVFAENEAEMLSQHAR